MPSPAEDATALLRSLSVELTPGLTVHEIEGLEKQLGFRFAVDHREFLSLSVPSGRGWPNWRATELEELDALLSWPVDGALFDVRHNSFWPASWGPRPSDVAEALLMARRHLEKVPVLVPVFDHRYLPAAPVSSPAPVFSVYQTDVIYYGTSLADYVVREFQPRSGGGPPMHPPDVRVPFWSDLAEDAGDEEL